MLRSLTAKQFLEWQAAYEIEEFGDRRADARAAYIVRGLYNIHRDQKKHSLPFDLNEFIADFLEQMEELEAKPRKQTWQEQKAMAMSIAATFNKIAAGRGNDVRP